MKSKLQLVPTKDMTPDEWLRYRMRGIGASEVGTILGLNPYKCSAQLFYEKLGEPIFTLETMAQFMGKAQESFVADLWTYWEGGEESVIRNSNAGRRVRKCRRVNAYVHNPDYPWLFVSLDRVINKIRNIPDGPGGEVARGFYIDEGALELKTIAGYEADKWESGIPPGQIIQVQTQLLVCEFPHGELATLRDGRKFEVLPFERNEDICQTIITRTKEFWDRVLEGRKLKTQEFAARQAFNFAEVERIEEQYATIEPPPDGSEAYAKYLKERYKIAEPGEQKGTDEQLVIAERHHHISASIKILEEQKRLQENLLKNVLRDGATKLDFGPHGYVSWKVDTNGTRRFLNKLNKI